MSCIIRKLHKVSYKKKLTPITCIYNTAVATIDARVPPRGTGRRRFSGLQQTVADIPAVLISAQRRLTAFTSDLADLLTFELDDLEIPLDDVAISVIVDDEENNGGDDAERFIQIKIFLR